MVVKHQIKLKPVTAEMVALCYQGMQAAQEYARAISIDKNVEYPMQNDFRHIAASLTTPMERIDKRIPRSSWAQFKAQVKDNDPIRLDNIRAIYVRMTPDQQNMAELLMEGILKGEVLIDYTNTPA